MNRTQWITTGLIVTAAVVLIVWDIAVAINDIPDDTISEIVQLAAMRWMSLPAAMGILMGHWFWPSKTTTYGGTKWILPIGIAMGVVLAADLSTFGQVYPYWGIVMPLIVMAYFYIGHRFWPMRVRD